MGALLDKLIESHIAPFAEKCKSSGNYSDEMFKLAEDALIEKIRKDVKEEIRQELTVEEIEKQKVEIDREIEAYSTEKALKEIKGFIIEGIILAVIIGLIVNQMTDIITYLKGTEAYLATIIIIICLIIAVLIYIILRFANTVGKMIKRKGK